MVIDIVEGHRQGEGSPKMAKMQYGVKPDILKDALLRGGPWLMSSIPKCFRGACVAAVRVSIHEILDGKASGNIQREVCGWKLFFLLLESNSIVEAGTQAAVRKHRQHVQGDISRRSARLALLG